MKKKEFIECKKCARKYLKKKLKKRWQTSILKEKDHTYEKTSLDIICECGEVLEMIEANYKTLEEPEETKGKVF